MVDSLFAAAGKPMRVEALTFDADGRQPAERFLNLGVPGRAWQFTSLANERDRPSLSLTIPPKTIRPPYFLPKSRSNSLPRLRSRFHTV